MRPQMGISRYCCLTLSLPRLAQNMIGPLIFITGLLILLSVTNTIYSKTREGPASLVEYDKETPSPLPPNFPYKSVTCVINQKDSVNCLKNGTDVFMPFSFIKDYFEVYGSTGQSVSGTEVFHFSHSLGSVRPPLQNYSATGIHVDDVKYYVEGRVWVIYVDGQLGVPLCRQWFPEGFFFSTNIAQYGLSHYSQYISEAPPTIEQIDNGGLSYTLWKTPGLDSTVSKSDENGKTFLAFKTSAAFDRPGITLTFTKDQDEKFLKYRMYSLSSHLRFSKGSSISVSLTRGADGKDYSIHYVFNTTKILVREQTILFGLGEREGWNRLSRNLYNDLEAAVRFRDKKINHRIESLLDETTISHIQNIVIRGEGDIHNLTISSNVHLEHFYDAAIWVANNQDEKGGWAIPVKRVLGTDTLQPGWYSALGQGVCMSLLARAYHMTKDTKYLLAAINATKIFNISSEEGGVRTMFMNKYVWYEEYPTTPSSFVLNGFITALLGLYDVAKVAPPPYNVEPQKLFDDGMTSLKALLPLYDSGDGSLYDLTHLTMRREPNRCRWDYHNVHVELLWHLSTIDNDPIFLNVRNRWNSYRNGWRSPHN